MWYTLWVRITPTFDIGCLNANGEFFEKPAESFKNNVMSTVKPTTTSASNFPEQKVIRI